ncbi:MAG: AraC family transcriptional regulator, partial [Fibrobacter sp.]|nr:AraC family transcriptional regulator [Fibrobacter sp.]
RKKALFNAFLQKVEEEHRENHSVKHYADELFVTPKYLSTVVEEMSGKSAKQWINEYIALDAKVLLQSTQKDIQEISNDLNFIDVSFFGKFFKRMTGMTPKAFREKKE